MLTLLNLFSILSLGCLGTYMVPLMSLSCLCVLPSALPPLNQACLHVCLVLYFPTRVSMCVSLCPSPSPVLSVCVSVCVILVLLGGVHHVQFSGPLCRLLDCCQPCSPGVSSLPLFPLVFRVCPAPQYPLLSAVCSAWLSSFQYLPV